MSLFFNPSKQDKRLVKLPIEKILPNPMQPRKYFDEDAINSLADSIARYGIIQPVSVRINEGKYELVAGERRLRAAKIAGYTEIPCIIIRAGEKKSAYIAMTENLQRCDLDIFEEAEAINSLLACSNCTQSALAESLSMSQSALANKLRLLRFDPEQRDIIRKYRLSERHARSLLRVPPEKRSEVAEKIGAESMSVTTADEYIDTVVCNGIVRKQLSQKSSKKAPPDTKPVYQEEKKPIRTFLIGDLSIFYNSIERSLSILKNAGYDASFEKTEEESEVKISIVLKHEGKKL
ncbi:MAG: ParB/RepB/Spo0J family partition protein [Ruminococcaceae bacterium]|nr:ParB/RepB/Spo0J family partition protein [Oscillospiraceae bacterium]